VPVGHNPYAALLSENGKSAYVSNWGEQSVSVVDTTSNQVLRTISLAPYPDAQQGSSPNALAVSENTLYVANAGNNDVAVIQLGAPNTLRGLIPTAWYPTALAVSPAGDQLYVANAKGMGAGPNAQEGPARGPLRGGRDRRLLFSFRC
jgi:YVTN family beta-propeller protein